MIANNLRGISEGVVRMAQLRGYVVPRQIRAHLSSAGVSETLWKDVIALARPALRYRGGRYYYAAGVSEKVRQEQDQQRDIHRAVRQLVREYRTQASKVERREQDRIDFVQPVRVRTEDDRSFTLLSRDLSTAGIRLIGTRRLLGQKITITIPPPGSETPQSPTSRNWTFRVRILWTCAVGEDLFENGGTFIEAKRPQL